MAKTRRFKLGIEKFLTYLGYQKFRLERLRESDPTKWNKVNLFIETLKVSLQDTEYLRFILNLLKPAIAELHILYEWQTPLTAYEGYTNAQEHHVDHASITFHLDTIQIVYEGYTNSQEYHFQYSSLTIN